MKHWPISTRERSRELRRGGASFSQITKELTVPKSTLSGWLRDIKHPGNLYYKNRADFLGQMRLLSAAAIRKKRKDKIDEISSRVQNEVKSWDFLRTKEAQKAALSLLYWAEGQKLPEVGSPVKFANTDPRLVLLFTTLLRSCYNIDPRKIKIHLFLHWYHNEVEVKRFWKDLLGLEDSQFRKTHWKKRSQTKKFRKNFMGICFVIYHSVDLRQEIMHTAISIQEKITGKINVAPVA